LSSNHTSNCARTTASSELIGREASGRTVVELSSVSKREDQSWFCQY
jgi:hypothetical protein